jgi:branched-chain amino acid transport system ATP-binding protein
MRLEVEGLTVHYGRLAAVRNLSLYVDAGEVVSIVGPNGAGKTTTLLAISGVLTPTTGTITFGGKRVDGNSPEDIARLGIAHLREGRHTFTTMTVEENLRVGMCLRRDKAAARRELEHLLTKFPQLAERRSRPAGKLSGGEQQMLVIARALLAKPRLIIADEPSLGLSPLITDRVYEILLELNRSGGMTLLIVEQMLERALASSQRIYVLRSGERQACGSPMNSSDEMSIRQAYFGLAEPAGAGVLTS